MKKICKEKKERRRGQELGRRSGEERCHSLWIQQEDLIVAIWMSMVGVIMAVLICWAQPPHNMEFGSLYTLRLMWECPSPCPREVFS